MPQQPSALRAISPDASSPGDRVATKAYVQQLMTAAGNFISQPAVMVSQPNTPGTSSPTYVMEGLDIQLVASSTKAMILLSGNLTQNQNGRETDAVICYGTGTPPLVGDPQAGTILTQPARFQATAGGGAITPFTLPAIVNTLIIGQTYWFDLALKVTGGNGNVTEVNFLVHGIA